jgi:hypothetical protein
MDFVDADEAIKERISREWGERSNDTSFPLAATVGDFATALIQSLGVFVVL